MDALTNMNYLKNVVIGCNLLAARPMGLVRKRIHYVFNCSNDPIEIIDDNNLCNHVIYINIKSDDDIIELMDSIINIFSKSDERHTIMIHSESLSNTRILLCKILIKVFKVELASIIMM